LFSLSLLFLFLIFFLVQKINKQVKKHIQIREINPDGIGIAITQSTSSVDQVAMASIRQSLDSIGKAPRNSDERRAVNAVGTMIAGGVIGGHMTKSAAIKSMFPTTKNNIDGSRKRHFNECITRRTGIIDGDEDASWCGKETNTGGTTVPEEHRLLAATYIDNHRLSGFET
jgi:hypothetical protein